jgi:hypothetical protein
MIIFISEIVNLMDKLIDKKCIGQVLTDQIILNLLYYEHLIDSDITNSYVASNLKSPFLTLGHIKQKDEIIIKKNKKYGYVEIRAKESLTNELAPYVHQYDRNVQLAKKIRFSIDCGYGQTYGDNGPIVTLKNKLNVANILNN